MSATPMVCNEKSWRALISVANARAAAKSREAELVATRKDLENQLDELGAGSSADHLRVSRDYVVTLRSIDFERDRIKTLADQLEKIISEAIQGKFEFAEEVDDRALVKKPTEKDLFHREPEPPTDTRPVGRPGKTKPEAPDPSKGDGVDEHLQASVNELDMPEKHKGKLIAAGFTTVGRLVACMEKGDDHAAAIVEAADVGADMAKQIASAVAKYRKAHRSAARTAERGE